MIGILMIAITGLIVGAVAKFLMPGDDGGGIVMTSLLGIGGAFVGNALTSFVGIGFTSGVGGFVSALVGALILLFGYNKFTGKNA